MCKNLFFKIIFLLLLVTVKQNNLLAQSYLWGMTSQGGEGAGNIFNIPLGGGTCSNSYNFQVLNPGRYPYSSPIQASNGKLYGLTTGGGTQNAGIIFEYDPITNIYTKKIELTTAGGTNASQTLIEGAANKLYGTTFSGGINGMGVIFEYNISTNTYTKKIDLAQASGSYSRSSLIKASNGKLYGTTTQGGASNNGVIFEYDITTNIYTKKIDFTSFGSYPTGILVQASNDKLYGTTNQGGVNNNGVIFEYDITTNAYTKKIDFLTATGSGCFSGLMLASNGKLYGMTRYGGANSAGVIFEYDITANTYTKKIDLSTTLGAGAEGLLMQASNTKLYGMTSYGGANSGGVLFEYDITSNTYTKKTEMSYADGSNFINGALIQATNGKLYGATSSGGASYSGVIFNYDIPSNTYTKKIDLYVNSSEGTVPYGSLTNGGAGKVYGLTSKGGANNLGVLFEIDMVTHVYTKKIDFSGTGNGSLPYGNLIKASNNKYYGLTSEGGTSNLGTLFEYDASSNILTKKVDFTNANGGCPMGSLCQASNGLLYGVARQGGVNGAGVLFEYNIITSTLTKKIDFDCSNGCTPYSSLIQATDGNLYGTTMQSNSGGTVFCYKIATNALTTIYDFTGTLPPWGCSWCLPDYPYGTDPIGSLVQASNGKLYGMTTYNGPVIYEIDLSNLSVNVVYYFNSWDGDYPSGSLMLASNNKLYGMTSSGGADYKGVAFQFDPATYTYTKLLDFNIGNNGSGPQYGTLIELSSTSNLPIELIGFDATCENNQINLTWTTATETNNDKFVLERSEDAIEFSNVIELKGQGNSLTTQVYNYLDAEPLNTINYYRLKQVDFNGKHTYSKIISIQIDNCKQQKLQVYPNPVHDKLYISNAFIGEVSIYNAIGNKVKNTSLKNNYIAVSEFTSGIYFLEINNQFYKFIKE